MIVADLFAGVGGLSQGFVQEQFTVKFAIESDRAIAKAYIKNHDTVTMINSDIAMVDVKELWEKFGYVDVIVGGPPCQGFSQKGKRLSLADQRNYYFRYFIAMLEKFSPRYFLLENVPNIISTSNGYFKNELMKAFNKLGYAVDSKVLKASDFGVPQDRRRAFFLGKKGKEVLPLSEIKETTQKTTIEEAIYDLPFIKSGGGSEIAKYTKPVKSNYQKMMRGDTSTLFNHKATNHSKVALERLALIPKGKGKEVLPEKHLTKSIYSGTWSRLKEDGQAATITTRFDTPSSGLFTHPILDRCLTVREAARIQSFPDSFIFVGNKTSQMQQVGNAVPPLLARKIAQLIKGDMTV